MHVHVLILIKMLNMIVSFFSYIVVIPSLLFVVGHKNNAQVLQSSTESLVCYNTRVVQKVLSLIGFLSFIPGIF